MKKCSVLLLVLSLMLSFCACFKSDKISSLEEIMENGTEWGDEQLQQTQGCILADMEKVWRKADGELSQKYAYFWKVNDMVSVNVYYHKNAEIEHITGLADGNNTDETETISDELQNAPISQFIPVFIEPVGSDAIEISTAVFL